MLRGFSIARVRASLVGVVLALGLLLMASGVRAAEVIPPSPGNYFNDYAGMTSAGTGTELNAALANFEQATSNQIWVVIYPNMRSDSDIADYTVRVAQAWRVGNKAHSNGAVLFVFAQDKKAFIQVGYGLEGALPDAICKQIIDQEITPQFKAGDFDGGVRLGVASMISATKGEYKGTGAVGMTDREKLRGQVTGWLPCVGSAVGLFLLFGLFLLVLHNMGGTFYQNHARSIGFFENTYLFILNMAVNIIFLGGSSGSSSSSSGGGGGFSGGGGGSFGGGGAGGSW